MAEMRKHSGSCHCGTVRCEVEADIDEAIACNCSICEKRGALLTFVGLPQFKLLSGEDALTDYQFNKKVVHHLFCSKCGVAPFARGVGPGGAEMIAVNVRCLDDVDIEALKIKPFDGKSL